jgi:hypothetical protein
LILRKQGCLVCPAALFLFEISDLYGQKKQNPVICLEPTVSPARAGKEHPKGGVNMKTCSLNGFMEELTPWLSKDYIREIYLNDSGAVVVEFLDATRHVYRVDDCTKPQMKVVLQDLKKQGIPVAD